MGRFGAMDLKAIEIEFSDGRLECWGRIESTDNTEFVGVEEDAVIEQAGQIILYVEEGVLEGPAGTRDLETGVYHLSEAGLFMRVDG